MFLLLKQLSKNKRLITVLMIGWALFILAPKAHAHAKLLRSQPANGEVLREKAKAIELTFNERLQATEINVIIVTDPTGKRVDKNNPAVSEDGKKLLAELEDLPAGIYSVEWRALSADNHSIKGKFSFTIAENNISSFTSTTVNATNNSDFGRHMPAQENPTNLFQSVARWLMYLAIMTLFGGFAFLLFVLKPSLQQKISHLGEKERIFVFRRGKNRFMRLARMSLFLIILLAIAGLILQTSAVLNIGAAQAFAPSNLFQTLTQTAYGSPFLVHIFVAVALFVAIFFVAHREARRDESAVIDWEAETRLLWVGLIISSLLFLMPTITGHARAASGEFRYAEHSDWLHQVVVGAWVGGLFHLILTLPKSIEGFGALQRLTVLSRVIPLFSRMAIVCAILLALTGIYSSWIHVEGLSALWNTSYGLVLLVKIFLFLLMLALGGLNTFFLQPRATKLISETSFAEEKSLKILRNFYRALIFEVILGAIVLLLASILAFLPPARRHETMVGKHNFFNEMTNPAQRSSVLKVSTAFSPE